MDQAPVQIGQFVIGKTLGIGAFGKVRHHFVAGDIEDPRCLGLVAVGHVSILSLILYEHVATTLLSSSLNLRACRCRSS